MPSTFPRGAATWIALLVALSVGCVKSKTIECDGGYTCPQGLRCGVGEPPQCIVPAQVDACANKDEREECAYGALAVGNCIGGLCVAAVCGNGREDLDEVCDDGNTTGGDGCSAACDSNESCGNGVTDSPAAEECDEPSHAVSGDGCSSRCKLEFPTWQDVSPSPITARHGSAAAFDPVRGRILLFGGQTATDRLGDTWEWDGTRWNRRTPYKSPPRRAFHIMAYDSARQVIVMHGGVGDSGELADTWTWDGRDWTEAISSVTPPPRREGMMAFDARRGVMVLYGGITPASDQTWEWNGTVWTGRTDLVGAPPPVNGHGLVYDEARQVIVLYGGRSPFAAQWLQQTWEYDGATWTQRVVSPPTNASWMSMVYDPSRARTVVFGGTRSNITMVQETWEWDGAQWTQMSGGSPPARRHAAVAYDGLAGAIVTFAGTATGGGVPVLLDDTWRRTGTTWNEMPRMPVAPTARSLASSTFDATHGRTLMFGGTDIASSTRNAETWEWENGIWTNRKSPNVPAGRIQHVLEYDSARGQSVLFGGTTDNALASDTWVWDGEDWTERFPVTSPSPRRAMATAFDAVRGEIVLFGGAEALTVPRDDTWTWNGTTWSLRAPAAKPSIRFESAAAYDQVRERVVLFGGAGPNFVPLDDTWEWDGTTWMRLEPPAAPAPRYGHKLTYDPQRQRIVLTGGGFGDAWEWDGVTWAQIMSVERPAVRSEHIATYDAVRRRLVVFGGQGLSGALADTWELRFEAPLQPTEACVLAAADDDGDGLAGCDDPDCWGRCAPVCPPGHSCPTSAPRCGDGSCAAIEDPFLCPADCP